MTKICWKCNQKIKFGEKCNQFKERDNDKKTWLHNECYLNLSKDEMKKISYIIKNGAPKGLRKNLKLEGFLIGGLVGGFGYSDGSFIGQMWGTKRRLKKKGITFNELDDICINKYGYHFTILPEKMQTDILNELSK